MKLKSLILALFSIICVNASAQTLLGGAEFSAKLPKNFSVEAGAEYRSADWVKHSSQWSVDASVGYKPLNWLKVAVGYKFIQEWEPSGATSKKGKEYGDYWNNKHRVSVGATGSLKLKKFTLSLRERYQYTYRPSHIIPFLDKEDGNRTINAKSSHILRSRLQASYKPKKKSPWEPYVSVELYTMLSDVNHTENTTEGAKFYDKFRATAGCEYKINKHNALELFYRYTCSVDPDENDSPHTIGLVYSFSL
ncbi:MAG: DUF2490 domain-containing protein [Bacteroides sp.]|nr:DUF2490 domain-containing protein [Bacteroides sp.]MCM1378944.1 DUF2490 domain-containing protein [Bacteroides sp.]MCM1445560.1 DUF2490 domain-containing protein [Prevotella sp.]